MKKVYICSPLRGDYEKNIMRAGEHCRRAVVKGYLPIAPHIYFTRFMDDTVPEEREFGMKAGLRLLEECAEIWVFFDKKPSEGMKEEIYHAYKLGIPILLEGRMPIEFNAPKRHSF